MYSKNDTDKAKRCGRTITLMLILVLVFILTIPSFAENETDETGTVNSEAVLDTDDPEGERSDDAEKEIVEDAGIKETEKKQTEEAEQGSGLGEDANKTDITDEAVDPEDKKSEVDEEEKTETESEEIVEVEVIEEEPDVISAPVPKAKLLKAASDGEKVSYTGSKSGSAAGETTIFKVTSDGTTYTGTCAEQGVTMSSSGTATITKISNSKKIAKVIYHYAIELGDDNWWTSDHKTDKVGKLLGMDKDSDTNVTKRRMIEAFCQIYNMGSTSWYKTITNSGTGGWNTDTADRVRDFYADISDKNWYNNLTVPDGFEIWFADAGNAQPFIIWAYNPTGYVTIKKVSEDSSITG